MTDSRKPSTETPRLWPDTFRRLAGKDRSAVEGALLCTLSTGEAKVSSTDEGVVEFVVSSEAPDRDRDVIVQDGIDWTNYQRNPVVLWAHDHAIPAIGRSLERARDGNRTISRDKFDLEDPFAASVYRKVAQGFLRAVSIGGYPMKWALDEERRGLDIMELDAWEHSVCNVPAHPDALARAAAADGVHLEEDLVFQWCMKALGESGLLTVQKATAEALVKGLKLTRGLKVFELSAGEVETEVETWRTRSLMRGEVPEPVSTEAAEPDAAWDGAGEDPGHYAWAGGEDDLRLPHHRASDGKIVLAALRHAAVTLAAQSDAIPEQDRPAVLAHLAEDYKRCGETAPWERDAPAWERACKAAGDKAPASVVLRVAGFEAEADAAEELAEESETTESDEATAPPEPDEDEEIERIVRETLPGAIKQAMNEHLLTTFGVLPDE